MTMKFQTLKYVSETIIIVQMQNWIWEIQTSCFRSSCEQQWWHQWFFRLNHSLTLTKKFKSFYIIVKITKPVQKFQTSKNILHLWVTNPVILLENLRVMNGSKNIFLWSADELESKELVSWSISSLSTCFSTFHKHTNYCDIFTKNLFKFKILKFCEIVEK